MAPLPVDRLVPQRPSPRHRLPTIALALALATPARGAQEGSAPAPVRAARLMGRIAVDGRLDEPAWRQAEPFTDFVQGFPDEGKPGSERTELRVLYDDRTLYVGVRCWDSRPEEIAHPLGRRDNPPPSDGVYVAIDSDGDKRNGVLFGITAGGVLLDALYFDDDQSTTDWDAVWDGAARMLPDGWSAELAIPLSTLRFPDAPVQRWGFAVQREMMRNHEQAATVLFPRNARGVISRLGPLVGVEGIHPGLDLDLTPYVAGRLVYGPLHSDASLPAPRVLDPVADVGLDFTARVGSRLRLAGAVNPDFGQVEADQVILNLTSFETFFPEKRPFFTQGLDVFQAPGAGNEQPPQQMFYSRRVGLDAPILGAAKLVGRVSDRVQVGFLDAVVAGTGQRDAGASASVADAESAAGRGLRWSPVQPFHLAPERHLPVVTPATANAFAGVVRIEAADRLLVGVQGTSAVPLAAPCRLDAAALDALPGNRIPAACTARGGNALALDLKATSADAEWYAYGQAAGSQVVGGPPERTLRDGVVLRPGDTGLGGYLRAGRRGGEPWLFDLGWSYASPRLDLNAAGYQRTQNEQEAKATVAYARPSGNGFWHSWKVSGGGYGRWTTDGRGLARGRGAFLAAEGRMKPLYLWTSVKAAVDDAQYDVREISQTSIPLHRPAWWTLDWTVNTDSSRMASLKLDVWGSKNLALAPFGAPWATGASGELALRPHPRLETRLGIGWESNAYAVRYVPDDGTFHLPAGAYLFGSLRAPDVSLVLRQLLVLTRSLTFQVYGQLFSASGRYGTFWTAAPTGTAPVEPSMMQPAAFPAGGTRPDFHETQLVLNAVLRWEWRPGATLYVVYARNQAELPWEGSGPAPGSLGPRALGPGPTTDSLLVKCSWWMGT